MKAKTNPTSEMLLPKTAIRDRTLSWENSPLDKELMFGNPCIFEE